MTARWSVTTHLLVSAAAVVVVVAGTKAAAHIVGPVMLALALTILLHPVRRVVERRLPGWVASVCVLVAAVALLLSLALAIGLAIARLAQLIPTYASDMDELGADIGAVLDRLGVGEAQTDAIATSVDPNRLADAATSVLSHAVSLTSVLFFIVTLLVFFSFDAAKAGALAEGARSHRPRLVAGLES